MTKINRVTGAVLSVLFVSVSLQIAAGARIELSEAKQAACGWLRLNPAALDLPMAVEIDSVRGAVLEKQTIFYMVNLRPSGFLILAADDRLQPVVAFSDKGSISANPDSPLYDIAMRDLGTRLAHLREGHTEHRNRSKWNAYLQSVPQTDETFAPPLSVSDLRVGPLVQSSWGQQNVEDLPCYDYYIPPPREPDSDPNNNIRCGCVATAMAQVMRYHRHPQSAVGVSAYTITVSGTSRTAYTRGGDGLGGPYNWCRMPLTPTYLITDSQRQAIGALCHDAGLTVNMSYSHSGSGAAMRKIHTAFKNFFQYSCAYYGVGSFDSAPAYSDSAALSSMPPANLNKMMNPGLDAGFPSILGIDGPYAGHAVVVDGYGYQDQTLYHHLNMGWYGRDNAWYALPDVNSMPPFSIIDACVYNVFPSGSGEIISGRVLDAADLPVSGAQVTAVHNGTFVTQAMTNERGIYALEHLPSEQTYIVSAQKQGFSYTPQAVYVAISTSQGEPGMTGITGNVWGVDFCPGPPLPPVAVEPHEPYVADANSLTIFLEAADEGQPNPPGRLTYILESLPAHGLLYDPNAGCITAVPYVVSSDTATVLYEPCGYYRGTDSLTFKANDGGTPPTGGDSNTATILIDVADRQIGEPNTVSSYPFHTTVHDCRMQLIYTADEVGGPALFSGLWLDIAQVPCSLLQNLTIRMQTTPMNEYPAEKDFVNTGWTTVYENDETITATGWYRFDFDVPYDCNEPNSILLDISFSNAAAGVCSGTVYSYADTNRDIAQVSDGSHGDPLLWTASMFTGLLTQDAKPVIRLVRHNPDVFRADFDADCTVDLQDLLFVADRWLAEYPDGAYDRRYDIAKPVDAVINLSDFARFASEWLLQKQ